MPAIPAMLVSSLRVWSWASRSPWFLPICWWTSASWTPCISVGIKAAGSECCWVWIPLWVNVSFGLLAFHLSIWFRVCLESFDPSFRCLSKSSWFWSKFSIDATSLVSGTSSSFFCLSFPCICLDNYLESRRLCPVCSNFSKDCCISLFVVLIYLYNLALASVAPSSFNMNVLLMDVPRLL